MPGTSKHVFGALARRSLKSSARRLVTVPALGALVLGILTTLPSVPSPVRLDTVPAASSGWLDRLNTWRSSTGVSGLTENTSWSQGDYNHALYMVKNDLVTHY